MDKLTPYYSDEWLTVFLGDCRAVMAEMEPESVNCVVTSPPYWGLRDYGVEGQLGLEPSPDLYVAAMVDVFRAVWRVLRDDGTLWLNLGDSYATGTTSDRKPTATGKHGYWENPQINKRIDGREIGLKPKDLVGIPWRVAFALQADGWYLRSDIVWSKPNPMPESIRDRPTKSHEYVFLLSKAERYHYDGDAIRETSVGQNEHDHTGGGYGVTPPGQRPQAGNRARYKMPDGWDTGPGGHGTFHRNGREKGAPPDKQQASAETASPATLRRMGGFNDRWDASEEAGTAPLTRNKRTVWTVATQPYPEAHYATFPETLIEPMILAGCPEGGTVLDPFAGSGTVGVVAQRLSRRAVLIDLSSAYLEQLMRRNADVPLGLVESA